MADYSIYQIDLGETGSTYPQKYDDFVTASEARAQEVENAREFSTSGATALVDNLQTYAKYSLAADIVGNGFKCTNMPNGISDQDYCTVAQANSIAASGGVADISSVSVGTLNINDIVVVNTLGTAFTGRSTAYTKLTLSSTNVVANGNYDMNLTSSRTANLPAGIPGTVISFADIEGRAGLGGGGPPMTPNLTIDPNGSEKIMNQTGGVTMVVDDYPFCSFDLVYIDATFGWTVSRFQR